MMRAWGASAEDLALAEQLRDARSGVDREVFEVWEENWAHWLFFLDVDTQWVFAGMAAVRVGLNWPAIEVVARAMGVRGKVWRERVEALLVVEKAVLKAEHEQAQEGRRR